MGVRYNGCCGGFFYLVFGAFLLVELSQILVVMLGCYRLCSWWCFGRPCEGCCLNVGWWCSFQWPPYFCFGSWGFVLGRFWLIPWWIWFSYWCLVILFATMVVVVFSSGAFCSTIGEVKLVFSGQLGVLLHDEWIRLLFFGWCFSVVTMDRSGVW